MYCGNVQAGQRHVEVIAIGFGIAQAYRIPVLCGGQPDIQLLLMRAGARCAGHMPGACTDAIYHDVFLAQDQDLPGFCIAGAGHKEIDAGAGDEFSTIATSYACQLPDDAGSILLAARAWVRQGGRREADCIAFAMKVRVGLCLAKAFFTVAFGSNATVFDGAAALKAQRGNEQHAKVAVHRVLAAVGMPIDSAATIHGRTILRDFLHIVFQIGGRRQINVVASCFRIRGGIHGRLIFLRCEFIRE